MNICLDSHAHLGDPAFDVDRDAVIDRAISAGLRYVLVIAGVADPGQPSEPEEVMRLADQHEGFFAAAGIHPHHARHAQQDSLEDLRRIAGGRKFLALGEIGLDYHYDHSPRDAQQQLFVEQLELARELKLPVIIHCREAWADLRAILRTHWSGSSLGGILHCFTGSREDAFELMEAGFLVSFAGNLTFKKSDDLRRVAKEIPVDRLLTETDSPYLAPVPHRGRRNEPAHVEEVLRQLAALRRRSEEEMATQVLGNFKRFFRL